MSALGPRASRWVFSLGLLCLSAMVYLSTRSPPTGYELSIYAGPPQFVWALFGLAALASVVLAIHSRHESGRLAGMVLTTGIVVTIGALPLLRSYWYFGRFDALNHLGLVKEMLAGVSANTTIYPATHLLAAVIVRLTGLSPNVALMLLTPVFLLLFTVGLYAIASHWGSSSLGTAVTGLVPLAIPFVISVRLPKLQSLPTVTALLLFPLLLYLLFHSLQSRHRYTVCLLVVASAHVLYHPQHALVLVLGMFLGNLAVLVSSKNEPTLRPRFSLPVFIGTLLAGWLYTKPSFWGAFMNVVAGVESDTGVIEGATPSGTSLADAGGSLFEVGAKVFVSKVLLLLGLLVLALYLYTRLEEDRWPSNKELYAASFLGTTGLFVPLFAVGFARSQMFRYIGAGVIFAVILFTMYNSERNLARYHPGVRHALVALLLLSAITALPAAYKSPYVYQPGEHVTQGEFDGYAFAFEHRHERPLQALGTSPDRYRTALYGGSPPATAEDAEMDEVVPIGANVTDRNVDDTDGTFVVTAYTRTQYTELYTALGYSPRDFSYLESGPGIHKLYSNGGTAVYTNRDSRTGEP